MGLVNDHVTGCAAGAEVEKVRRKFIRPRWRAETQLFDQSARALIVEGVRLNRSSDRRRTSTS